MMAVTLTILFTLLSLLSTASCRTMVGEITAVADVKENREVQELGKFAVEKYNEGLRLWKNNVNVNDDGGEEKLQFGEVVEAQQQVVSGTKYYMKILATQNGVRKMFTSVVVVKPWLHSKKVLNFSPSSSSSSSSQR